MTPFELASTPDPDGDLAWSEDWYQGRGAYGGAVAAALWRTMAALAPGRSCRSLTVHFAAPPARARFSAALERKGSRVSHLSARAEHEGQVQALALASFARPRPEGPGFARDAIPQVPGLDQCLPVDVRALGAPPCTQHFLYRLAPGPLPFSGSDEARIELWCRPAVPQVLDVGLLVGLLDVRPPPILTTFRRPRELATVDLRVQVLTMPQSPPPEAWWLVRAISTQAREGYVEEQHELWSEAGVLVARSQQLVAVLS
jgi:acyl-CoA thioesterase